MTFGVIDASIIFQSLMNYKFQQILDNFVVYYLDLKKKNASIMFD